MKFASLVTLASLAVCAFAQSINIGFQYDNMPIKPGQHLTVQVNRPTSHDFTVSKELALAISLVECPMNDPCPNPADITLGTILFLGPFDPEVPTTTPDQVPQQNFTVIVPGSLTPGRTAQLVVTHLAHISISSIRFFFYSVVR